MQNYVSSLLGGALIGLSATLLLLFHGRVAGISGILGTVITPGAAEQERRWRIYFLLGLVGIGVPLLFTFPTAFAGSPGGSLVRVGLGGLLVGYGTRLGSGCTSGHGVCGVSRLSLRSIVATLTFIAFGAVTVFVLKGQGGYQ
jgi:uncharacterized protein